MRDPWLRAALALGSGALVALSMPPWGWWPLAFAGIALFDVSLGGDPSRRRRFALGTAFGVGWMYPGMCWMWFLTPPGYVIAAAVFGSMHGLAALIAPTGRWSTTGRAAAHTLVEAARLAFPFGGVPLATIAIGQAAGPLLGVVRVGGMILLTWVALQIGFVIGAAARRGGTWRTARLTGPAAATVVIVVLALVAAPAGSPTGQALRVTAVQGGGPQGTHAVDSDSRLVFERHLAATQTIAPGSTDLVVWPENVIDVAQFSGSRELDAVAAEASRIGAPITVGITEDVAGPGGQDQFLNAQVVVAPDGSIVSRYEKVHRVPFGEYVPLRGLLEALGAPTDLVPRDAVAGSGPAVLVLPGGVRLATAISWEVFFGDRVAEGVDHGASAVINPTNGSSYTWTVLQTQQVASSRLRAVEQGRWLVQVSPTGFSAFVSPGGEVISRTGVSEARVIAHSIELRRGRTWYSRVSDVPFAALAAIVLAAAIALARRDGGAAGMLTPPASA